MIVSNCQTMTDSCYEPWCSAHGRKKWQSSHSESTRRLTFQYYLCLLNQSQNHTLIFFILHAPLGVHSTNVDISLQSGRFWATSNASFRERLLDFRSWCILFIHIVWRRPGGLLHFSKGEAVKIFLASVSSSIHARSESIDIRRIKSVKCKKMVNK